MPILLLLLGLGLQDDPQFQQQARERAQELRRECAQALEQVDGVGAVGLGGSGTDYRIVVAVRDAATQRYVRDLIGDTYGGVRILWSIAEPPRRPPAPSGLAGPPRPPPLESAPEPLNPWNASPLDCDIIRDHLKLKAVPHPADNGKSWVPCQVMKRTTIGPGGVTTFSYTKHRPDCPIRMGRVSEPPGSDYFMAWVFREGITAPTGGTFALPSNDWAWGAQAAADLASRLPLIRDGSPAEDPVWMGGYGWIYPDVPYPWMYPYRPYPFPSWRFQHWYPLRWCPRWRGGR
ncbi:MAG TPA: hypothetical protein VKU80_00115 [Planctomycetota bacterium]|nr:hypothetical protein [Planctomycetota bacterium]